MAEPLDEPLGVVAGDELGDEPLRLGERLEVMEIEALLLQRAGLTESPSTRATF